MFRKLLVPLDRSSLAEQAIGKAVSIARGSHAGIEVVLVHEPFPFEGYVDLSRNGDETVAERRYVDSIAKEIRTGSGIDATATVTSGTPAGGICAHAREARADLIVMTSHGRTGFSRMWIGSVADAVMRGASIPVLMLRPRENMTPRRLADSSFKRVLVPLDGSTLSADVVPAAVNLARASQASILLFRVSPIVPMAVSYDLAATVTYPPVVPDEQATKELAEETTRMLDAIARRLHEDTGLTVDASVVVSDETATSIVEHAASHDADVIAMSTHGRGASRWLFGSVADKVLRASNLPILLRRALHAGAALREEVDAERAESEVFIP